MKHKYTHKKTWEMVRGRKAWKWILKTTDLNVHELIVPFSFCSNFTQYPIWGKTDPSQLPNICYCLFFVYFYDIIF